VAPLVEDRLPLGIYGVNDRYYRVCIEGAGKNYGNDRNRKGQDSLAYGTVH
jgi:hypothetical protein